MVRKRQLRPTERTRNRFEAGINRRSRICCMCPAPSGRTKSYRGQRCDEGVDMSRDPLPTKRGPPKAPSSCGGPACSTSRLDRSGSPRDESLGFDNGDGVAGRRRRAKWASNCVLPALRRTGGTEVSEAGRSGGPGHQSRRSKLLPALLRKGWTSCASSQANFADGRIVPGQAAGTAPPTEG